MKKSTKDIPKGDYCYKILSGPKKSKKYVTEDNPSGIYLPTRYCPYFTNKFNIDTGDIDAYCEYIKEFDIILLNDSCKICGIKYD